MIEVGAYEAKTHLSSLLAKVSLGEQVIITKHHVPVAKIIPVHDDSRTSLGETIERMKKFKRGKRLAGLKLKDLILEGRR